MPLFPLLLNLLKERRKQIGTIAVVFSLVSIVYLPLAWNSNGAWELPARAIRSQTDPNQRDLASNSYRSAEEYDLKVTRDVNQIIGYGYGRKFIQVIVLPNVTTDFVYYMPHNSILWVWMRIGNVGFFLFWMMIAMFIIRGLGILKEVHSSESRIFGILALCMLLMTLTFGKYDLALVDSRVLSITAILIGVLGILPKLETRHALNSPNGEDESEDRSFAPNPLTSPPMPYTGGSSMPF